MSPFWYDGNGWIHSVDVLLMQLADIAMHQMCPERSCVANAPIFTQTKWHNSCCMMTVRQSNS